MRICNLCTQVIQIVLGHGSVITGANSYKNLKQSIPLGRRWKGKFSISKTVQILHLLSMLLQMLSALGKLSEKTSLFDIIWMLHRVMKDHSHGMFDGTVKCHPACNGQTPCIASCTAKDYAWNETAKGYTKVNDDTKIPFSEVEFNLCLTKKWLYW